MGIPSDKLQEQRKTSLEPVMQSAEKSKLLVVQQITPETPFTTVSQGTLAMGRKYVKQARRIVIGSQYYTEYRTYYTAVSDPALLVALEGKATSGLSKSEQRTLARLRAENSRWLPPRTQIVNSGPSDYERWKASHPGLGQNADAELPVTQPAPQEVQGEVSPPATVTIKQEESAPPNEEDAKEAVKDKSEETLPEQEQPEALKEETKETQPEQTEEIKEEAPKTEETKETPIAASKSAQPQEQTALGDKEMIAALKSGRSTHPRAANILAMLTAYAINGYSTEYLWGQLRSAGMKDDLLTAAIDFVERRREEERTKGGVDKLEGVLTGILGGSFTPKPEAVKKQEEKPKPVEKAELSTEIKEVAEKVEAAPKEKDVEEKTELKPEEGEVEKQTRELTEAQRQKVDEWTKNLNDGIIREIVSYKAATDAVSVMLMNAYLSNSPQLKFSADLMMSNEKRKLEAAMGEAAAWIREKNPGGVLPPNLNASIDALAAEVKGKTEVTGEAEVKVDAQKTAYETGIAHHIELIKNFKTTIAIYSMLHDIVDRNDDAFKSVRDAVVDENKANLEIALKSLAMLMVKAPAGKAA